MDRSQGRWPDRAVILFLCILFMICIKALLEVYSVLDEFRKEYEYLNERTSELEAEVLEHTAEIKHIEHTIFDDWEINQ